MSCNSVLIIIQHISEIIRMDQLPKILKDTSNKISSITKKPESFLTQEASLYEKSKLFTKVLYDISKLVETSSSRSTLPELIIENFDPEQVWAGVELQNKDKLSHGSPQYQRLIMSQ